MTDLVEESCLASSRGEFQLVCCLSSVSVCVYIATAVGSCRLQILGIVNHSKSSLVAVNSVASYMPCLHSCMHLSSCIDL